MKNLEKLRNFVKVLTTMICNMFVFSLSWQSRIHNQMLQILEIFSVKRDRWKKDKTTYEIMIMFSKYLVKQPLSTLKFEI